MVQTPVMCTSVVFYSPFGPSFLWYGNLFDTIHFNSIFNVLFSGSESHIGVQNEYDPVDRIHPRCLLYQPVRAFLSSFTLSLDPEGADMRSVTLVVWCSSGQFEQHITVRLGLADIPYCHCTITLCYLKYNIHIVLLQQLYIYDIQHIGLEH